MLRPELRPVDTMPPLGCRVLQNVLLQEAERRFSPGELWRSEERGDTRLWGAQHEVRSPGWTFRQQHDMKRS